MAVNYSWNNLPVVVVFDVFQFLDKQDLLNASTTCKAWRSCLFHPKIWPIKSMTIDLVNISAYEFKNSTATSANSYRGYVKKPHQLLKPDPYNCHHHYGNRSANKQHYDSSRSKRFSSYQLRLNERLTNQQHYFSNGDRSKKQRQQAAIENTLKDKIVTDSKCSPGSNPNIIQNKNQHQLLIKNNSDFYAQNAHLKADYRQFLEKCGKFLTKVTIQFNAYDHRNLIQLVYTINILTHARSKKLRTYDGLDETDKYFNNIESLILKPIYIKTVDKTSSTSNLINRSSHFSSLKFPGRLNKRSENINSELLLKVFDGIEKLIATNRSIRQLSLGCLEELLDYLPSLLNKLKNNLHVNELLESLNLATIKVDPFYYPVHDVKFTWFTSFKNLVKLSIDYDYISDDFIIQLATNCKKLKDLTLNIHGLDKLHPIVNTNAWNSFKQNANLPNGNCEVELTINILHTNESPEELKEILQNVTIPIVNFRAYFAFSSPSDDNPLKQIMNVISTQQQLNLRQLTLVDELKRNNTTFSSMEENTLVMLAWRCRNLNKLTLIGEYFVNLFFFLNNC